MSDMRRKLVRMLRAELGAEAAADFPVLGRIPHTRAFQLLDYFDALEENEQDQLLDALALRAAALFMPDPHGLMPATAAFDKFWSTVNSFGAFSGGYRYCDVKMLSMVPKIKQLQGFEGWIKSTGAFGLALEPRADLMPCDILEMTPAKAPLLRKLVKSTLVAHRFTPSKRLPGGEVRYLGQWGDRQVAVWVDFASRYGQLQYGVTTASEHDSIRIQRLPYELLWSISGGWDYLTEENAARCIELLPECIDVLCRLADRLNQPAKATD